MNDQLWTSAKHMAQADGRKDDWVYVVDIYKSMGGKSMQLMLLAEDGKRYEVIGEVPNSSDVIVKSLDGATEHFERAFYKKSKKKFNRIEG